MKINEVTNAEALICIQTLCQKIAHLAQENNSLKNERMESWAVMHRMCTHLNIPDEKMWDLKVEPHKTLENWLDEQKKEKHYDT